LPPVESQGVRQKNFAAVRQKIKDTLFLAKPTFQPHLKALFTAVDEMRLVSFDSTSNNHLYQLQEWAEGQVRGVQRGGRVWGWAFVRGRLTYHCGLWIAHCPPPPLFMLNACLWLQPTLTHPLPVALPYPNPYASAGRNLRAEGAAPELVDHGYDGALMVHTCHPKPWTINQTLTRRP